MLLTIFNEIPDHRRAQGRQYDLPHMLLFYVFAVLSGADSYRSAETYIKLNFKKLKKRFKLTWKKAPSYSTIRDVVQGVSSEELEKAFRKHSLKLSNLDLKTDKYIFISMDGKTIKGSFDNFKDQKAIQIFSALLSEQNIILAHEKIINRKTNEIPMAQKMIKELNLKNCKVVFTFDAMHCQKKLLKQQ